MVVEVQVVPQGAPAGVCHNSDETLYSGEEVT